jgi:hypothetical protein
VKAAARLAAEVALAQRDAEREAEKAAIPARSRPAFPSPPGAGAAPKNAVEMPPAPKARAEEPSAEGAAVSALEDAPAQAKARLVSPPPPGPDANADEQEQDLFVPKVFRHEEPAVRIKYIIKTDDVAVNKSTPVDIEVAPAHVIHSNDDLENACTIYAEEPKGAFEIALKHFYKSLREPNVYYKVLNFKAGPGLTFPFDVKLLREGVGNDPTGLYVVLLLLPLCSGRASRLEDALDLNRGGTIFTWKPRQPVPCNMVGKVMLVPTQKLHVDTLYRLVVLHKWMGGRGDLSKGRNFMPGVVIYFRDSKETAAIPNSLKVAVEDERKAKGKKRKAAEDQEKAN